MEAETTHQAVSVIGMFNDSDIFMKILILGLLFASLWSWAIIFDKFMTFRRIKEKMRAFEEKFWSGISLNTLLGAYGKRPTDPLSWLFVSAMREWQRLVNKKRKTDINIQEMLDKNMQITIDKQVSDLENRMVFLASTGSVAPLLGLFGTVWGIMDSFNSIGMTQSTNIAAVAPGVAEALLTTAVGLIAAIPAVIAYNKLSADINQISRKMETFADEFGSILVRQAEQVEGNEE